MDQLYPENGLDELPDGFSDLAMPSSRTADHQRFDGFMGPAQTSMTYLDQHSTISDLANANQFHHQLLMVPGSGEAFQDLRPSPTQPTGGYLEADPRSTTSYQNGLLLDSNDAWNPLRVTGVPQISQPDTCQALNKRRRMNGSDDGTLRNSEKALSDIGSLGHTEELPDSAYGTRSAATGSVIESLLPDGRLAVRSHGGRTNARNSLSSEYNVGGSGQTFDLLSQAGSDNTSLQGTKKKLKCDIEGCKWTGKTSSDKKKHETRHQKPYKCDQEGCKRSTLGFGTINDLDRHRWAVHRLGEPRELYKCFAEDCVKKESEWPRLDNFRKHLERMHGGSNVNELMKKSHMWFESLKRAQQPSPNFSFARRLLRPSQTAVARKPLPDNSTPTSAVLGPWAQDNIKDQADGESVLPTNLGSYPITPTGPSESGTFEFPSGNHDDNTASLVPEKPSVLDSRGRQRAYSNPTRETSPCQCRGVSTNSQGNFSKSSMSSLLRSLPIDSTDDEATKTAIELLKGLQSQISAWDERRRRKEKENQLSHDADFTEEPDMSDEIQERKGELRKILLDGLTQLGSHPEDFDQSHRETSANQPGVEYDDQEQKYLCHQCSKKFDRQSELKKHMKRHDRPYQCTFPNCKKNFGSKNDWKRHENSQHFQLQSWRCHIKSGRYPFAECNRLFYRKEKFIAHLDRRHEVKQEQKVSAYLKRDEIGRNGQSRFWCGFCRQIIPLKHRGMDAWNERFNHIDDRHFSKGERMEAWLHPVIHRSDSPVDGNYEGDTADENAPDHEPTEVDSDHLSDAETALDDREGGKRTQKLGVLPVIRIEADQTAMEGNSFPGRSIHPRPKSDTTSPQAVSPQPHKRKFAPGLLATTAFPSYQFNQGQHDSTRFIAPKSADNPTRTPTPADFTTAPPGNANSGTPSRASNHASTVAALFSTTYPPQRPANRKIASDIAACLGRDIPDG
ncbi:hypothetical protein FQN54_003212 [Arachnomyces sp. PD_36]|nr:hypothetical protein FQN54_003212 [Arachnomyces sp. PD_36]